MRRPEFLLVLWAILAMLLLSACSAPRPCWFSDVSCNGDPGKIYVIGKIRLEEGADRKALLPFAVTMALGNYTESVALRIQALDYVDRVCRKSKDKEECELETISILKMKTRAYVGQRDLTVEDIFEDDEFLYIRGSIDLERFQEHVKIAANSLPMD